MRIQRNVSQTCLCLVVLLTVFLLLAGGCGGPQSSPKAIAKAYFDNINSHRCSFLAALFYVPPGWDQGDAYIKKQIAACESYGELEIDMAHLDASEVGVRYSASPADKANGFGDQLDIFANFAVRERNCSGCRWDDDSCSFRLQEYKGKWWIMSSDCPYGFIPTMDHGGIE